MIKKPLRYYGPHCLCVLALLVFLSTSSYAEENAGWLTQVEFSALRPDQRASLHQQLVTDIDGARTRIDAALFHLQDDAIGQALIRAQERGVQVRIVADEDNREDTGFKLLESQQILPVYGDGPLSYLPDPTLSPLLQECETRTDYRICTQNPQLPDGDRLMVRPAFYNLMSHTFFLIDETTIWNFSTPFVGNSAYLVGWRMQSELIMRSFEREFEQMHGGVFATTLSVYNGPLKSLTQRFPVYQTDKGTMRILFNPQERLVKTVIDEVYRAKSSIFIVTEDLANPWLMDALEYKRRHGFDVRIVVGQGQSSTQQNRVMSLGAVQASAGTARLPTMVIIDNEMDRNGQRRPRILQVLSHPLWRAAPFEVEMHSGSDRVRIYPADSFVDGTLWEIVEEGSARNAEIDRFLELWKLIWEASK